MSTDSKKFKYTLPIGTSLKGAKTYHIEEVLGQGGYGITYKVWAVTKEGQIPVKVPFAIKEHFVNGRCHRAADGVTVEYSQEAAEDVEESLKDFVKEGRLLNKICQADDEAAKFIVPVNEVIEANNTAYFVMQYLEGGSLRRMVLNSGAMMEERALTLIKPIARAVDFIHHHKVLHMDIKPENIVMHRNLLTGQEEPVLIDFGVSLHFNKKGGLTSKHTSFGHTEGFSPIEQYGAVESFAPWIDVYALGATLYYLLTGKTPPKAFDMTPDNVDKNLPPEVSKRTRAAIKHAMTKDYHDRTQSASTFLWELENDYEPVVRKAPDFQKDVEDTNVTVKKKVVQTKGTNPPPPVSPTHKRKWIWLLAACVVLVALFVVFKAIPNGTTDANQQKEVDTVANGVKLHDRAHTLHESANIVENDTFRILLQNHTKEDKADGNSDQSQNASKIEKSEESHLSPQKEPKPEKSEKPVTKVQSDAEVFEQAYKAKDWKTIEELGNKGYAKAYYPLAHHYRDIGYENDCKKWANKAIESGIQVKSARKLLKSIE